MTTQTLRAWSLAMEDAPVAPAQRLIGDGGLVVLAPHPDDETIGASGLLQAAARQRLPIGLVALTDGDGSHRGSISYPPERLAAVRRDEQAAAMALLCGGAGFETLRLGLPDGASGRDARFAQAPEAVAAFCDRIGATALAAPHPDDPHPDHHAAAALALAVRKLRPSLRILFYEVWSRRLENDVAFRSADLTPFRVRTDVGVKRAALECHASQFGRVIADDPAGFTLPDWFLKAQDEPLERVSVLAMPGDLPGAAHFRQLYAETGDPWHVRASDYEREKREASIALLVGTTAAHALELGCGEGYLTRALVAAGVAAHATGVDRDGGIVERARRHPDSTTATRFVEGSMPDDLPSGPFDLIVLSEVLYFLDEATLARLVTNLRTRLADDARILTVCYKGPTSTPLSGVDAGDFFAALFGEHLSLLERVETPDYRAECFAWRREEAPAPADVGADPTGADAGGARAG